MSDFKTLSLPPSLQAGRGTFAARPAAGIAGRLYTATDWPVVYRDNGATWDVYTWATGLAKITADVVDNADSGSQGAGTVTVLSFTIPANVLQVGTTFRLWQNGVVNPTSVGPPNMTLSSQVAASASNAGASGMTPTASIVADTHFVYEVKMVVRAIGAGTTTFQNSGEARNQAGTNLGSSIKGSAGQTTGKDSTGTIAISLICSWSAATTGNVMTMKNAAIELVLP